MRLPDLSRLVVGTRANGTPTDEAPGTPADGPASPQRTTPPQRRARELLQAVNHMTIMQPLVQ